MRCPLNLNSNKHNQRDGSRRFYLAILQPGKLMLKLVNVATPLKSVTWLNVPLNVPLPAILETVMVRLVTAPPLLLVAVTVTNGLVNCLPAFVIAGASCVNTKATAGSCPD